VRSLLLRVHRGAKPPTEETTERIYRAFMGQKPVAPDTEWYQRSMHRHTDRPGASQPTTQTLKRGELGSLSRTSLDLRRGWLRPYGQRTLLLRPACSTPPFR
jgi:hypothetical protein